MGATCSIALFGALLFLAVRRPKNFTVSVSFLAVCFIYALLFPRVLTGRFVSAFMEICGGMLLFSSVFFLTDDKLLPKSFYSRICYGAAAGLMCMIMRSVGKFEDSTVFAVLLANGLVTAFDKLPLTKREKTSCCGGKRQGARSSRGQARRKRLSKNGKGGAEKCLIKRKKSVSVIRSSAIIKNPVLFEAIGIAPVVAMAVSLKSAIILSFVSFVELLLIECLACLLMKKLKGSVRKMIYAILGLLINIPLFYAFPIPRPQRNGERRYIFAAACGKFAYCAALRTVRG